MTDSHTLLPLMVFAAATTITPGPTNIMATYSGMNFGFRRTLPFVAGMAAGFFGLVFLCAVGVGSVVAAYPWLRTGLQWFGAGYLVYLAIKILGISVVSASTPANARQIGFWESVVFQFSNPKAWMMGLSASSLFVLHADKLVASVALASVLALTMTVSVCLWVKGGALMKAWLIRRPERQKPVNAVLAMLTVGSILLL